ncbi:MULTISPECIES: hypothetical protein [Nostoc]|uniref:CpcA n=2 Tax=Nostoc TaxID=1177 RepID=A0ABR8IAD1_9NOSO|nr:MULTISPECIES: hypothetical protein [Nostoc]MBD2562256.1 hypothetical protein [Nostoc linckia FACHB-391]MBD2647901.1 hypothetical protein [Nostoc foliaceum FACHB-393]
MPNLASPISFATIKSFTAETYERSRVFSESEAYRRSNARAIAQINEIIS